MLQILTFHWLANSFRLFRLNPTAPQFYQTCLINSNQCRNWIYSYVTGSLVISSTKFIVYIWLICHSELTIGTGRPFFLDESKLLHLYRTRIDSIIKVEPVIYFLKSSQFTFEIFKGAWQWQLKKPVCNF